MSAEQAAEALQKAAEATQEAIAAVAAAKVALDDARKPGRDPEYVFDAAQTFRSCEAKMNDCIQAEVVAHIALFDAQIADFDPTPSAD